MAKLLKVVNKEQCIGCYSCMYACSRTFFAAITVEKAALRVRNYDGVEGAFSIRTCAGCIDPECAAACEQGALVLRKGGGVRLIKDKCTGCNACVEACVRNVLTLDYEEKIPLVCSHCGVCVNYCPTNVLAMVESNQVDMQKDMIG